MKKRIDFSIVIPAYNEEARITSTLESIDNYFSRNKRSYEVIVVDDGSSDGSSAVVSALAQKLANLKIYTLQENKGKGYAVRFGALRAHGDLVLFNDADGATPIEEIEKLESALVNDFQVAIGSRAIFSEDTFVNTVWYRRLLGRIFNRTINLLILPGIADTQCGFKMFTKEAAQKLFSAQKIERFAFDVELLFLARKFGYGIKEVPINWTNIEGSKVNLLTDSTKMLFDVLKLRVRYFLGAYR